MIQYTFGKALGSQRIVNIENELQEK